MLARLGAQARHTRDIDLLNRAGSLNGAERSLRAAATADLGDYFSFTLSPGRQIVQGAGALRVDIVAFLGLKEFARFHVDLVTNIAMTGAPDTVSPLVSPGPSGVAWRVRRISARCASPVLSLAMRARRGSWSRPSVSIGVLSICRSAVAAGIGSVVVSSGSARRCAISSTSCRRQRRWSSSTRGCGSAVRAVVARCWLTFRVLRSQVMGRALRRTS